MSPRVFLLESRRPYCRCHCQVMYTERKRPLQLQSYMPASRRKLQQSNMGPRINQPVDGIDTRKPLQDLPRATSKLRGVQQVAGMLRNGEEGLQNFVQENWKCWSCQPQWADASARCRVCVFSATEAGNSQLKPRNLKFFLWPFGAPYWLLPMSYWQGCQSLKGSWIVCRLFMLNSEGKVCWRMGTCCQPLTVNSLVV